MAEKIGESGKAQGKSATRSSLPMVLLIVVLAIAAITVGAGLVSSSGSTHYACFNFTQHGNNVELSTSGIIHIAGSLYYVTCAEGNNDPTTSTTVSCLTINPQIKLSSYPSASTSIWYYLSAAGHTITVPPPSVNSSEVLQPTVSTIQVSC